MKQKKQSLYSQFRTVDPDDSIKVAKIQAKINILENFLNKPKKY